MKRAVLSFACLAAASASAGAGQPETSIPVSEAAEPVSLCYGAHTTGAVISPPTDLDRFVLHAKKDDLVWLHLRSLSGGFDPFVQVLDQAFPSTLTPVAQSSCDGSFSQLCTVSFTFTVAVAGEHAIHVSDSGLNESGAYVLQMQRLPPVLPAPGLQYNLTTTDMVAPTTDVDFFRFQGAAGSVILIHLQSLTGGFDPVLQILDSDGQALKTASCNGSFSQVCSTSLSLTLPESGTYLVGVWDSGADENGSYNLSLNCFFGACPDSPAGLTADVTSLSLAGGGVQTLSLDAGAGHAHHVFLMLGSVSGCCPGLEVTPSIMLPLNLDPYFLYTATRPLQPPLSGASMQLDATGKATVLLTIPPGSPAALAGLKLHHAFVCFAGSPSAGTLDFWSNAVEVTLAP